MELESLNKVGLKTAKNLNTLGIYNIEDLVNYYPFRYESYELKNINELKDNEYGVVRAIVESDARTFFIKKNLNRLSFKALIDDVLVNVTIFNRAYLKNNIEIGKTITLIGKYEKNKNNFIVKDIKLKEIEENKIDCFYHVNKNIKSNTINKIINNTLDINTKYDDYIPTNIIEKYNFLTKYDALKIIHNPKNFKELKQAKLRLIYEELFIFMFKISYLKHKTYNLAKGIKRSISFIDIENYINDLPFRLTDDQLNAVKECYKDLVSEKRMNRLILGDVGSGKTIVAIISMIINCLSGYQSALLAPTEILAKQHYFTLLKLTKKLNIRCEILTGSMTKKEKDNIKKNLENGSIDIIVGTHALISEDVIFNNLGLVVTDEQHRFGVNQRNNLHNKGNKVDILYLSATPIPRTYALTIYGDMDTTLIKQKPAGRKEIITKTYNDKDIKQVLLNMLNEIKQGNQIYVVSSLIENEEDNELKDVNLLKEKLEIAFSNKVKIGLLHGKLKNEEKETIMNDFKNGVYSILISTTIVEVGVDVANATMMVIFDADRFGLATLHQLRGRVGRNEKQSYCYLISNKEKERLKVLEESNDGFYISQKDFEMRKEGDLFGTRQSGDMSFKIADIKRDYKILLKAKEDVEDFIKNKYYLNNKLYKLLINGMEFIN